MSPVQLAAALAAVVLVASVVSVELGGAVALLELTLGVVAGNAFHLHTQDWLDFVAKFASIVLTFLAGMEVDPSYMRRRLEASLGIGVVSFVGPFVVASLVAYFVLDWSTRTSLITGTALCDDVARGGLRRARRARADGHRRGQAPHERAFRHRPLHGSGTLGALHQAEPLVSGLPGRLAGVDPRPAASRPVVLRPLRRPGDRAGD